MAAPVKLHLDLERRPAKLRARWQAHCYVLQVQVSVDSKPDQPLDTVPQLKNGALHCTPKSEPAGLL